MISRVSGSVLRLAEGEADVGIKERCENSCSEKTSEFLDCGGGHMNLCVR